MSLGIGHAEAWAPLCYYGTATTAPVVAANHGSARPTTLVAATVAALANALLRIASEAGSASHRCSTPAWRNCQIHHTRIAQ